MTVGDWLDDGRQALQDDGAAAGVRQLTRDAWPGFWRRVGRLGTFGETYWERDWDVLVLLDSCRYDLLAEAALCHDCLPDDVQPIYSAASMSEEWAERHTAEQYTADIAETALVSANPHTRIDCVQQADWADLDEVWRHSWDEDVGTVPPRAVTDATIRQYRQGNANRIIAWYMQPHQPFVGAQWSQGYEQETFGTGGNHGEDVWRQCRDGKITREQLWQAYRRTLDWVLDDVRLLLNNLHGSVAITADHGNAMGEWGVWGHPKHVPIPAVKKVPWVEIAATDTGNYSPAQADREETDANVDEKLRALGYA